MQEREQLRKDLQDGKIRFCVGCHIIKPKEAFYSCSLSHNYREKKCKNCINQVRRTEYALNGKFRIKERNRLKAYYQNKKNMVKLKHASSRERDPETMFKLVTPGS